MSHLKKVSARECLNILCNKFGFRIERQRGSHISLKKETPQGKIGTVIPNHKEIKLGTLKSILRLAGVTEEEFSKFLGLFMV